MTSGEPEMACCSTKRRLCHNLCYLLVFLPQVQDQVERRCSKVKMPRAVKMLLFYKMRHNCQDLVKCCCSICRQIVSSMLCKLAQDKSTIRNQYLSTPHFGD